MAISVQQAQVESLYIGYFNRPAEPAGLAYWMGQLDGGLPLAQIAQSFSVQPEATALYPFLVNPTQGSEAAFLGSVYGNIFDRPIDAAGLAYWSGQLDGGQLGGGKPVGRIILDMISGAQGADRVALNNKAIIGVEYAQAFDTADRTWTAADLASALSVLTGVTSDPATVTAAEAKIMDIFASTATPGLTTTPTPTPTPTITPTPTPGPTPTSAPTTMNLFAAGDSVALNSTTGTIILTGADLVTFPAAKYGTVDLALASGALFVGSTAGGTLDATGNSAATTYDFGTGVVGGTDTVNSKMTYQGFTSYLASSHGDTVTLTASGQRVTGGAGADSITGGPGTHTVSGGGAADTFNVTAGTVTIGDLGNGGTDVLKVSAGATANATLAAAWTATASSSNAGTASVNANGFNVSVVSATGANGWTLTNSGGAATLIGSANADTIRGGAGDDIITGGAGNDTLTGGLGHDTFNVTSGTDTITDVGGGSGSSNEIVVVSPGATAIITLAGQWTATPQTANDGTASIDIAGHNLDLENSGGAHGWTVTNSGAGAEVRDSVNDDTIIGGAGADILLSFAGGNDTLTGGDSADLFVLAGSGTATITDLGAGGTDRFVAVGSAVVNATLAAAWTAADSSQVDWGIVTVDAKGFDISVAAASGTGSTGWTLINSTNTGITMTGSARNDSITGGGGNDILNGATGDDTLSGGDGNDTLTGGGNNDTMTGGAGVDTFNVDAGTDTITDLGVGGTDVVVVSAGATAFATLGDDWTPDTATANAGTASVDAAGFLINLGSATGANGWTLTNSGVASWLRGSTKDDVITGGTGGDALGGGDGNDVLTGGAGSDVLNGGAGADVYRYVATTDGSTAPLFGDTIHVNNFVSGTDSFNFVNAAFGSLGTGALTAAAHTTFNTNQANTLADLAAKTDSEVYSVHFSGQTINAAFYNALDAAMAGGNHTGAAFFIIANDQINAILYDADTDVATAGSIVEIATIGFATTLAVATTDLVIV